MARGDGRDESVRHASVNDYEENGENEATRELRKISTVRDRRAPWTKHVSVRL